MTENTTTPYSNRCDILAELWVDYKNDVQFQEFFEYNDLGLPLAYAISTTIVASSDLAENFINETFFLLLEVLGIADDTGFDSLADVLLAAQTK
jgi:hypothetical protein